MGANEGVCEYLRSCFSASFLENSNILFTSLKRFSSLSQCVLVYNTLSPLYRCLHLGLGFRCHRFIKLEVAQSGFNSFIATINTNPLTFKVRCHRKCGTRPSVAVHNKIAWI